MLATTSRNLFSRLWPLLHTSPEILVCFSTHNNNKKVGKAAITRRLMARLIEHRRRQQEEQQQDQPQHQHQPRPEEEEKRGGIAAVLTLLRTDADEKPQREEQHQQYLSVLGDTERWSSPGAGRGAGVNDGWEEIVVCEEDTSVVGEGGGIESEAWRQARELGTVKVVRAPHGRVQCLCVCRRGGGEHVYTTASC